MRDFVTHNYLRLDLSVLRSTILENIPYLREKCAKVLKDLSVKKK